MQFEILETMLGASHTRLFYNNYIVDPRPQDPSDILEGHFTQDPYTYDALLHDPTRRPQVKVLSRSSMIFMGSWLP
jgi:hypothetical protein